MVNVITFHLYSSSSLLTYLRLEKDTNVEQVLPPGEWVWHHLKTKVRLYHYRVGMPFFDLKEAY